MPRPIRVVFVPDGGQPVTGTLYQAPLGMWGGSNEPFPGWGLPGMPPGIWGPTDPFPGWGLPGGPPVQVPPGFPGSPAFPIWGPPGVVFPPKPGYPPVAGHPLPDPPEGPPELPDDPQGRWIFTDLGWIFVYGPVPKPRPPGGGGGTPPE